MDKRLETAKTKLIVALDFDSLAPALTIAKRLAGSVGMFKIGKQLFTAAGPEAVQRIASLGSGIFLDLKFHDIPNTVACAVAAAARLRGVHMLNVHALGGLEMMKAARKALPSGKARPRLLAVTILTSLDESEFAQIGILGPSRKRVVRLARLAQAARLDGVVASPLEVAAIRQACGPKFLTVIPGVRPNWASKGDQTRVATPNEAIRAGAHYIVVGRPITQADNPEAAARAIVKEIVEALR